MAAYVVSEVTTLTGAGGVPSCDVPTCRPNSSNVIVVSISVGLVFMRSDGPDRLECDLMIWLCVGDLLPLILRAEKDPFTLPHRERGDQLSGNHAEIGC